MTDFTKPHPRTVLWWKEREQCRACDNLLPVRGTAWSCNAVRGPGRGLATACMTARDPEFPCGPAAALFKPAG